MNISVSNLRRIRLPGLTISTANDINDHGQIVGKLTDANGAVHGFVYNDGVLCQIDYPGPAILPKMIAASVQDTFASQL